MIKLVIEEKLTFKENIEEGIRIAKKLDEKVCFEQKNNMGPFDTWEITSESLAENITEEKRMLQIARHNFRNGG